MLVSGRVYIHAEVTHPTRTSKWRGMPRTCLSAHLRIHTHIHIPYRMSRMGSHLRAYALTPCVLGFATKQDSYGKPAHDTKGIRVTSGEMCSYRNCAWEANAQDFLFHGVEWFREAVVDL